MLDDGIPYIAATDSTAVIRSSDSLIAATTSLFSGLLGETTLSTSVIVEVDVPVDSEELWSIIDLISPSEGAEAAVFAAPVGIFISGILLIPFLNYFDWCCLASYPLLYYWHFPYSVQPG